jgi:hypothetical protein
MPPPTAFARLRADPLTSRVQDQLATTLNPVAQAVASTPIMGAAPPAWVRPDLVNGFADAAGPSTALTAFHRDALGYTWLRLNLSSAVGTAALTVACVLPVGYRPSETLVFPGVGAAGAFSPFLITPAGEVKNGLVLAAGGGIFAYQPFLAER